MKIGLIATWLFAAILAGCATQPYLSTPDAAHSAAARKHTGIPSLAVAPSGRLWATWYGSPTGGEDSNNYCTLATSDDRGETWRDVLVADPDGLGSKRAFDPEVWVSPEGRLFWTWTERVAPLQNTAANPNAGCLADPKKDRLMCVEFDADAVPAAPFPEPRQIARGVMMCKPTVLDDGTWLFPSAHWSEAPSACFYASTDRGRTFTLRGGVTLPQVNREYDEHTVTQLKNGDLLTFVRAEKGTNTFMSVSHDRGRTWETAKPANFRHTTSRIFVKKLRSGNILLVKHGAINEDCGRRRLTAYLSTDDGKTWKGGLLIDARKFASYPDGDQAADGTIYLVYDNDRLGEQEVLCARFTEADVLAGKWLSDPENRRWYATSRRPKAYQALAISPDFDSPIRVVNRPPITTRPPDRTNALGHVRSYVANTLYQVTPDTVMAFVNREYYTPCNKVDFDDGTDILIGRSLEDLRNATPIPLSHGGIEPDPDCANTNRWFLRGGLTTGGFVPVGAKLNGRPHPHAGTGFAVLNSLSLPVDPDGLWNWNSDLLRKVEVFQLAWRNGTVAVTSRKTYVEDIRPLAIGSTDYDLTDSGIDVAIPDGEDFLLPCCVRKRRSGFANGPVRWRCVNGEWRPVDFRFVSNAGEASMVRLRSGALLLAARDDSNAADKNWRDRMKQDLRVWRSDDNGETWRPFIHVPNVRMNSPVGICRTSDGNVFIAANPSYSAKTPGARRNTLVYWPIDPETGRIGPSRMLRDAAGTFAGGGLDWNVDHPTWSVLRFGDGRIRSFVSYRVRDEYWWKGPDGKGRLEPNAEVGSYADETTGDGEPLPVWEF